MPSSTTTVTQYLASLPKDRRDAIKAVRKVIRANLDDGYAETVHPNCIAYCVPHSVYPPGYHCDPSQPLPYVAIGSQKNYMAVYLFCIYTSEEEQRRFRDDWVKSGKKLDMGKSCLRFKKIDDVALDVLGKSIKRTTVKKFIAHYEAARAQTSGRAKKTASKAAKTTSRRTKKKKTTM